MKSSLPKKTPPSIFNDVIGPVMRGPSSSHTAAAVRIGRIARDLMGADISDVLIEFDPNGSLATTHTSQGSDMGLFTGLLGWDPTDDRMVEAYKAIREAGIHVKIQIRDLGAVHPNTYQLTLRNTQETHQLTAISTGGGMIEVIRIDGINLSIRGDTYETLIFLEEHAVIALQFLTQRMEAEAALCHQGEGGYLLQIQSQEILEEPVLVELRQSFPISSIRTITPVLPVLWRKDIAVPFLTCDEMLAYNQDKDLDLWELAVRYECARGGLSHLEVIHKMDAVVEIIENSVQMGLQGTVYADRILGNQSGGFQEKMAEGRLLDGGILNQMILYTTALMEAKSAMGVIVAAPTAGACGGLPGACLGAGHALGLPGEALTRAMLAAGIIGIFIVAGATFAAEIGGCQAECGAGSGMAAAALVTLAGGSTEQAVSAASMALQNILGMVCDPVANRVEVPCLGKNILAVSNALACANMALADYDPVIPLDEVITAMNDVGIRIPHELRCTGLGGLSVTPTSKRIEAALIEKNTRTNANEEE